MCSQIQKLPIEVTRRIVNFLLPRDVLSLSMTSHGFNEVRTSNQHFDVIHALKKSPVFITILCFSFSTKVCKLNSDKVWNLFFERYFKIYCSLEDFKFFLANDMNWKTLCRQIFSNNAHNPHLHRLVCNFCNFSKSLRDCSTGKKWHWMWNEFIKYRFF